MQEADQTKEVAEVANEDKPSSITRGFLEAQVEGLKQQKAKAMADVQEATTRANSIDGAIQTVGFLISTLSDVVPKSGQAGKYPAHQ